MKKLVTHLTEEEIDEQARILAEVAKIPFEQAKDLIVATIKSFSTLGS